MAEGILPRLPLYVDSPLAHGISGIYEQYPGCLQASFPGDGPAVHYLQSREESHEVSTRPGPCIIVASGGMCEGGRIVWHLRHHIDDPRSSVVLVSYQAPHSLGAQLLQRRPTVRFHGRTWNKWIEVVEVNGFSGHADRQDFLALLGPASDEIRQVRLVHGEPDQAEALASSLRDHGLHDVAVPHLEDRVSVA
jgi:metallo-beta-lactamase family protein